MADTEEQGQTPVPRGADWEVVSLTASAYAAAPGADMTGFKGGKKGDLVDKDQVETSNALFMSGHFVLPLELENTKTLGEQGGEDDVSDSVKQFGGKPNAKEEENWALKKLTESDDFHGIQFSDEKGNTLSLSDAAFTESTNLPGKQQNLYDSSHNEATMGALNIDDETGVLAESIQSSHPALGSNIPNLSKQTEEDNYDESGQPCQAWWKKHVASLNAQAKETNTFWPIFVAAAVVGIVVISKQWQQERWQVLHHHWKSSIVDERIEGPISRLKDAIVGGNRQDFFMGVSTLREH